MKNTLIFGVFLAVMACIGTIAGCALTKSLTGESPIAIVTRWREEDAGGASKPVKPIKKDDSGNKSPSKGKDDTDDEASSPKENDAQDATKDSASGKEVDSGKKVYKMGETWTVDGQWSLTVTGVAETSARNEYSERDPGAVYIVDYTYTNIGYRDDPEGLFFVMDDTIVDSASKMGYSYPGDVEKYATRVPIDATCDAQVCIGVENPGDFKIFTTLYDDSGTMQQAVFEVSVS